MGTPLSKENQRKLLAWMTEHDYKGCSVCSSNSFGGSIVAFPPTIVYEDGSTYVDFSGGEKKPLVPFMAVGCMDCGYTFLLSALVLGIAK